MASEVSVTFDGKVFTARKRGCPGSVFGNTQAEAIARAAVLKGKHPRKIVEAPGKRKKRGHKKRAA
jgi:hypothetical protein